MFTRTERLIAIVMIGFVIMCILLFSSDVPSETIAMICIVVILTSAVVFYAYLYIRVVKNPNWYGKDSIGIEILGVSDKDTVLLYVDEKLMERYMGEIYAAARFKCRRGEHTVTIRYKEKMSSTKIDTSEMMAKMSVRIDGSGIRIQVNYTSDVPSAEELQKGARVRIKIWLAGVILMTVFVFAAIIRILAVYGLI